MEIKVIYTAKWQLKCNPKYKWTEYKKLINTNTGREIKKTIKGLQPGYWIGKNFIKLSEMTTLVELIPKKEKLPF